MCESDAGTATGTTVALLVTNGLLHRLVIDSNMPSLVYHTIAALLTANQGIAPISTPTQYQLIMMVMGFDASGSSYTMCIAIHLPLAR